MRLPFLLTLAGSVVLLLSFQSGKQPTVITGQGKLGLVNFPEWFVRKDAQGTIAIISDRYQVRCSNPTELLFGMKDNGGQDSENFYIVSLNGQFHVRAATGQQWRQAQSLPTVREDEVNSSSFTVTQAGVSYQGRLFPTTTGESWTETRPFLSPNKRWLAILSDNSKPLNRPGIPGFDGTARTPGELFVDVYYAASGAKILSGSAPHRGGDQAARFFVNSLWIDDRFLVVPLDANAWHSSVFGSPGVSCFLGILPDK